MAGGQPGGRSDGQGPGRITGLLPDPRRTGVVQVEVDGARFASVPEHVVHAHGMRVGLALDEALRERLEAEADVEAAYRTALRSIERRPFARVDLSRRLLRKGHPRRAVETALERAAERGYLDDAAFAANYVETRAARGRGPLRLARDLMAMGVERAVIDRALAALHTEADGTNELPRTLAAKRAAQLRDLPRQVRRRRVLAYLARRGFSGREVSEMVARMLA